ncbi:MAG: hypothetical protein MUF83_07555 [Acidimicrobiales bacterium]|nr:hypothetical protein [Acidimicrobiales bacterium]
MPPGASRPAAAVDGLVHAPSWTGTGIDSPDEGIAEGYDADLPAIDGDPLTDPSTLHAIRAVFLRGERMRFTP